LPGGRPGWLGEKEKTEKEKRKRDLTEQVLNLTYSAN
jgi:hypothetical protein